MTGLSSDLLLAYTAELVGVASPGPSVLAVMGTAMAQGRTRPRSPSHQSEGDLRLAVLRIAGPAAGAGQLDALAVVGRCGLISTSVFVA